MEEEWNGDVIKNEISESLNLSNAGLGEVRSICEYLWHFFSKTDFKGFLDFIRNFVLYFACLTDVYDSIS